MKNRISSKKKGHLPKLDDLAFTILGEVFILTSRNLEATQGDIFHGVDTNSFFLKDSHIRRNRKIEKKESADFEDDTEEFLRYIRQEIKVYRRVDSLVNNSFLIKKGIKGTKRKTKYEYFLTSKGTQFLFKYSLKLPNTIFDLDYFIARLKLLMTMNESLAKLGSEFNNPRFWNERNIFFKNYLNELTEKNMNPSMILKDLEQRISIETFVKNYLNWISEQKAKIKFFQSFFKGENSTKSSRRNLNLEFEVYKEYINLVKKIKNKILKIDSK